MPVNSSMLCRELPECRVKAKAPGPLIHSTLSAMLRLFLLIQETLSVAEEAAAEDAAEDLE